MTGKRWNQMALAWLATLLAMAPAGASTFPRVDLEYLVSENETIVVGEAVAARSYWNDDHSFILTDVTFVVAQTLKGEMAKEIVVTVPGGTVGELTSAIVGGAELAPGRSYLLFLDRVNMLGVRDVLAVHDHGQGIFDVELKDGAVRAFSQARKHELVPDTAGQREPLGGADGIVLDQLIGSVREIALRGGSNEVRQ